MSEQFIQEEMKGVIVATATGFDGAGGIVFEPIKKHIDACIKEGVHGFWVNGCTGLSVYLEESERKELTELSAEQIAGRVPMWVHVGSWNTSQSCRLAEHAAEHGAIGVSSLPPLFYSTNLDKIVEHLTAIQKASGLPITYYHVPGVTKVSFSADELIEMCERVPKMAAIKFSDIDIFKAVVIRERVPHIRLMTGFEEILLAGLALGCFDGTVGAGQNFLSGPLVDIYNFYGQGKLDEARKIHCRIARLLDIQGRFDFTAATYAFLNLLGFEVDRPRAPMTYLNDEDSKMVRKLSLEIIKPAPFEEQRLIRSGDFRNIN